MSLGSWFEKIWHMHLGGSQIAWSNEKYIDNKLVITKFNPTYANVLRQRMPEDLSKGLIDSEIVKLNVERINSENEKPFLNVIHSSIDKDNQIQVKLDWNDAFIKSLQKQGFEIVHVQDLLRNKKK